MWTCQIAQRRLMSQIQDESCNVMDKKSITAADDNIEMKGRQIYIIPILSVAKIIVLAYCIC